jgi:hypothetical protein
LWQQAGRLDVRTIAKSLVLCPDEFESFQGVPAEVVGVGFQGRMVLRIGEPQQGECDVGQAGQTLSQSGPSAPMPIFVPPTVFDVMEAVLHLPMTADVL